MEGSGMKCSTRLPDTSSQAQGVSGGRGPSVFLLGKSTKEETQTENRELEFEKV